MNTRTVTDSETTRNWQVKRMFTIHGWSGVLLGLLLYAVIVTGTVAVFHHELEYWTSPLPQATPNVYQPGLDQAVKAAAASIDPAYLDEVTLFSAAAGRLGVFFHHHVHADDGEDEFEEGALFEFDPRNWQILDQREGSLEAIEAGDNRGALAEFLVDLHVRLYLPRPWGLILTGILGLAMMVAAVTGLVVHRKLIRELFTQRLSRRNVLLTARDRHVLAGSWNLIFTFVLAFTGSFFSFAASFGIPVMAMVAAKGDQERLVEAVIGLPAADNPAEAQVANLDTVIADAMQRNPGTYPQFININRWGRADGYISLNMSAPDGDLQTSQYLYQADSGELIRMKPNLGLQPSLGDDLLSLMGPLHFGHFAGLASKAVWFGLGAASAYVVLSGLLLWTRRRQREPGWQHLHRMNLWMGYGLLLALSATPVGFFLSSWLPWSATSLVPWSFVTGVALASVLSLMIRSTAQLAHRLQIMTATLLLLAVALRWASGGPDWQQALQWQIPLLVAIDLVLLLAGLGLLLYRLRPDRKYTALQEGKAS